MIYLKTEQDIQAIKKACDIWKLVKKELIELVHIGMTTYEVDTLANKLIKKYGAKPTFYHLYDFPGHICISVNDQLIHGIGNNYVLKPNDLITCDIGITYDDHVCDSAFSWILPPNNDEPKQRLLDATIDCLEESVKIIKPGIYTGDISAKTYEIAKKHGYEVIKDFAGHGCGNKPHEDPLILNWGSKNTGVKLVPGMVVCIEPMLMEDSDEYTIDSKNNWTVCSKNHKLTCHFEYMVLVTDTGCEILTKD